MRKCSILLILILITSVLTIGCASDVEKNNSENQTPDANEEPIQEDVIEEEEDTIDEKKTIEGSFTGWIDNNSFEIISNDEPFVIRTNPDVTMPDDELEGKNVRITYTTNEHGQNIIQAIEVL